MINIWNKVKYFFANLRSCGLQAEHFVLQNFLVFLESHIVI